jgi:predicted ATPase
MAFRGNTIITQRHLFLPFIDELKQRNKVVYLSAKDFRIRHDIIQEKFLYPLNQKNEEVFYSMFLKLTDGQEGYIIL